MIEVYCKKKDNTATGLCENCQELFDFASAKLDKCPWGEKKPACSKCTIHCYPDEMREKIRKVMRFSGPRMIIKNPLFLFSHYKK